MTDAMTDAMPHAEAPVLFRAQGLSCSYLAAHGQRVDALNDVSFTIRPGETLGLVGESGSGKSTLAKCMVRLTPTQGGQMWLMDQDMAQDITQAQGAGLRQLRERVQMVFQDPLASLNPSHTIVDAVRTPLLARHTKSQQQAQAREMLNRVGLDPDTFGARKPRELSGGQCQRVSIARALVGRPQLLICDEAVSALDVSVQAQVLNLLEDLKQALGTTMLFISHDLGVVRNISDRVMVLYLGKVCEVGETERMYEAPLHPYTAILLSAIPKIEPRAGERLRASSADMPSPLNVPTGCRFHTRCPQASERCQQDVPELRELLPGRQVACHHPLVPVA
jgi:peptide/nickel transport system ATP-binding protein